MSAAEPALGPYGRSALDWLAAGLAPLPLPPGVKWPPPKGWTGREGPWPSITQVKRWRREHPHGNIALRLPRTVIGIDVDVYGDKPGDATLAALIERYGPLPPTWRVTARGWDNGSGIRLYRIPEGLELPGVLGPGIEVIQFHHRYCVAPGSEHPDGGVYEAWHEADKGTGSTTEPFAIDDFPDFPEVWADVTPIKVRRAKVNGETSAAIDKSANVDREAALAWLREHAGEPCRAVRLTMRAEIKRLEDGEEARHDAMVEGVMALVRLGSEGHLGVRPALRPLKEAFLDSFTEEERRGDRGAGLEGEWERAVVGGVAAVSTVQAPMHKAGACPLHNPEVWPSFNAPLEVAARYVDEFWSVPGATADEPRTVTLRRWRGGFYRHVGPHYEPLSEEALMAEIGALLRDKECYGAGSGGGPAQLLRWNPNPAKLAAVMRMLHSVPGVLIDDATEAADGRDGKVALRNGILDLTSRVLSPHTPTRFALTSLPFDFEPDAACSEWLAFLDVLWPDDDPRSEGQVELLQEWFGYVLSGSTRLQKMMLLLGPTRSGKGVISRMLEALLGAHNVTSPSLDALATNFGLQSTIGKSLATIGDARFDGRNNAALVERLLTLSGGDSMMIDRKNRDPWEGRATVRIQMTTNELPMLRESSGALVGRFLGPLETSRSFLNREDEDLEDRLHGEVAGVLAWALDGLDVLREQGWKFTRPTEARTLRREWTELNTPVAAFIASRCVLDADAQIERGELYAAYQEWCSDVGQRPISDARFGRDLRAAYGSALREIRPRRGGERSRVYVGVALREDA